MNKKSILIICAIVLAVALLATGAIFLLSKNFNGDKKDNGNSDPQNSSSIVNSNSSQPSSDQDNTSGDKDTSNGESAQQSSNNSDKDSADDEKVPNEPAFYIGTPTASKGETVKVPVKVTKNPGFMAILLSFEYDPDVLKYKGYSKGNVINDYQVENTGSAIKFMSLSNGDVKKDGTLLNLEFEVISDKPQTSPIKFNTPSNGGIMNMSEKYVDAKNIDGAVIVK